MKEDEEFIENEPRIKYPRKGFFKIVFQSFLMGMNKNQLVTLIITILMFILNSSYPLIYGKILNLIIEKAEGSLFDSLALLFLFLKFGQFLLSKLNFIFSPPWSEEGERIKQNLLEKLVKKDIEFFDFEKPANIVKAYNEEFYIFRFFEILEFIDFFLENFFQLCFACISLFLLSRPLFYIELLKIIVKVLFHSYDTHSGNNVYSQIQEIESLQESIMREAMINIKLIKTFSSEDKIMKKLEKRAIMREKISKFDSTRISDMETLVMNLIKVSQILYSIRLINAGELTFGDFSSFELIAGSISKASVAIYRYLKNLSENSKKAERFLNYIDYEPKLKSGKLKKEIQGLIEFKNVNFSYPTKIDVSILFKLNVTIKPGEIVAFVGSSGCGKSTISTLTQRLYDTTGGKVLIDGTDIKEYDLENLHSQYGYISQDPMLFSGSIRSNLTFAVDKYTQQELDQVCKDANCYDFIMNKQYFPNGYDSEIIERGSNLSGGQRQRLAIARALMKKVKILILDEATSALDSNSENEVQKALDHLCKESKITTIIIAHRLSTVKNCDKIYVLKNGGIIEEGKHFELLELNGEYKKLVEKQLELAN